MKPVDKIVPREIKRLTESAGQADSGSVTPGSGLAITWSNGESFTLQSRLLRLECPCAECLEKRGNQSSSKALSPRTSALRVLNSTIEQEINLAEIYAVGNYALGIRWGDGHTAGIYTYDYLYHLCTNNKQQENNKNSVK